MPMRLQHSGERSDGLPEAWVLGDLDLVRPLQLAGIPCAVMARAGSPEAHSRYARSVEWHHPWREPDRLLETLLEGARALPEPPVLFYQLDAYCSFISRNRAPLEECFRFVLAGEELVRDCLDKSRFLELARRLRLPVPASQVLLPAGPRPAGVELDFPMVLKPSLHGDSAWYQVEADRKAVKVQSPAELAELWPRLVHRGQEVLAQELVPGPETRIESYHAYRGPQGEIFGEFTGRKVRTHPAEYGHSTAVVVKDIPDVRLLGREVAERMGVDGVVKLDFKRAPDDSLVLLEANPRFSLWHHPGAYAGVNLPAMVWSNLTGLPVPRTMPPREEATWMNLRDFTASREWGVPALEWAAWAWRCDAKWFDARDDLAPLFFYATDRAKQALRRLRGSRR